MPPEAQARPLTVIAVSNMLGDIFDCAIACGYSVRRLVLNQAEVVRARTLSYRDRLTMLPAPPVVIALEDFTPAPGEPCFLGTTAPGRDALVAELHSRFDLRFVNLVHPGAVVSPFAVLGNGVFVNAGCVIGPNVVLGDHVFVNRGATVGHDTRVGAFSRLQPGCNLGGHIDIGPGVTVGMGACVIEELVVGAGSTIAVGAAVTRDVPPGALVAGPRSMVARTLAVRRNTGSQESE